MKGLEMGVSVALENMLEARKTRPACLVRHDTG